MNTLGIFFEVGDSYRFGLFEVGRLVGKGVPSSAMLKNN
jgi:hypothetical protein